MEIQVWKVGLRELGLRYLVSLTLGGKLPVPAQGNGIHLSTRDDLHSPEFCGIFDKELEPYVEQFIAIRCFLSQQGTFGVRTGFDTVSWDDLQTVPGVLEGGTLVMRSVKPMGDALQEGLWEGLWH